MPDAFARARVQADGAVGEEIVAFAAAAVKIRRGRAGADKHQPAFLIHAGSSPIVGRAGVLPGIALPSAVAKFARPRNGVETPEFLSRSHIECARIARRCAATFGTGKPEDDNILI